MMRRFAGIFCLLAQGALADPVTDAAIAQLTQAQSQLEQAKTAEDRVVALTQTVLAYERGLVAVRDAARDVADREALLQDELDAQQDKVRELTTVLTVLTRAPHPVRKSHPGGPVAALRAGMSVAGMTEALEAEIAQVAALAAEARDLRLASDAAAAALEDGQANAAGALETLRAVLAEPAVVEMQFADDASVTQQIAADAQSLAALADQVAAIRPDPADTLAPEGNLPLPVAGLILPDDGSSSRGVRIAAQPRALVTTPVTATVLYAAPYLDYGSVVILEPAPDLVIALTGMAEIFAQAGQVLPAGAAVGLLPDDQRQNDANLTGNLGLDEASGTQTLYLEVREQGAASQPDRWFALE